MTEIVNLLSLSGGKDSTAMLLLAYEREVDNPRLVFADTGHEHPATYEYLDYLDGWARTHVGVGIERVRADFSEDLERRRELIRTKWPGMGVPADRVAAAIAAMEPTGNPFLDLCKLKGRFPSTKARFCTQELKHYPITRQVVSPILATKPQALISWQGVRAEESPARAKLPMRDVEFGAWKPEPSGFLLYRPLLRWTADEVFDQHRKHGVNWNPLYEQGMGRVGCMPCIMCRKSELKEIGKRFPEEIERVAAWENEVVKTAKRGAVSFFATDKTPIGRERTATGGDQEIRIHDVIEWAKSGRGGRQFGLFEDEDELPSCSSQYGLCE